jgi:hypothetical protein
VRTTTALRVFQSVVARFAAWVRTGMKTVGTDCCVRLHVRSSDAADATSSEVFSERTEKMKPSSAEFWAKA